MANQLRDSKGRFLPKDAHPEDLHFNQLPTAVKDGLGYSIGIDRWEPPTRPYKRRKRVILGYIGYVVLCFVMGAVGAYIGARG